MSNKQNIGSWEFVSLHSRCSSGTPPSPRSVKVTAMSNPIRSKAQDKTGVESTLQRIQRDFLEMPGLRLTSRQAQRLWGLDALICDALLKALVDVRFLVETDGIYISNGRKPLQGARPAAR
jgi:hypothetical protein